MGRLSNASFTSIAAATLGSLMIGLISSATVHALVRRTELISAQKRNALADASEAPRAARPIACENADAAFPADAPISCRQPITPAGALGPRAAATPVSASLDPQQPAPKDPNRRGLLDCWNQLGLTHAEGRVAQRIIKGDAFSTIASDLGVSHDSVRQTACRIYRKAGVGRRNEFTARVVALQFEPTAE